MKKIVGMFAAAAVLATSVFAADITAKVQLEGNLFKFNADKSISAFDIGKPSAQTWNPIFDVAVNNDNAGAKFRVATGDLMSKIAWWQKGYDTYASAFQIWMSPADGFKFIFGQNDFNLNQEHICWSKSDSGIDELFGYSLKYSANGFSVDLMLADAVKDGKDAGKDSAVKSDITPWMSKSGADNSKVEIGKTGLKAEYSADFGKINAILVAENTFKKDKFGIGYSNNFSGINMFLNVLGYTDVAANDAIEFQKIRAEVYAEGNVDAFGWALFPVFEVYTGAASKVEGAKIYDKFDVKLWAKFSYRLEGATAYLQIEDPQGLLKIASDVGLDNGDGFIAKLGANGNVGGASWDVAAKLNLHGSEGKLPVDFSIPVTFSMQW